MIMEKENFEYYEYGKDKYKALLGDEYIVFRSVLKRGDIYIVEENTKSENSRNAILKFVRNLFLKEMGMKDEEIEEFGIELKRRNYKRTKAEIYGCKKLKKYK